MAAEPISSILLEELRLRAPVSGSEGARRFGESVARHLARLLPDDASPRQIGALRVRVLVDARSTPDAWAEAVARKILEALS